MNRRIREPYVRWCERRTRLVKASRAVYSIIVIFSRPVELARGSVAN